MDYLITHNLTLNICCSLSHSNNSFNYIILSESETCSTTPVVTFTNKRLFPGLIPLMSPLKEHRNYQLNQSEYRPLNEFIKCIRALLSIKNIVVKNNNLFVKFESIPSPNVQMLCFRLSG